MATSSSVGIAGADQDEIAVERAVGLQHRAGRGAHDGVERGVRAAAAASAADVVSSFSLEAGASARFALRE